MAKHLMSKDKAEALARRLAADDPEWTYEAARARGEFYYVRVLDEDGIPLGEL